MEHSLSKKASKILQRFPFSRSSQALDRVPVNSSSVEMEMSLTCPSNDSESEWDNDEDRARHYDFKDQPGYFCPSSPIITRQELDEDLEDDMASACALLVQSVDRGLPMWPSFHNQSQLLQQSQSTSAIPRHLPPATPPKFADQVRFYSSTSLSARGDLDSGIALSLQSLPKVGGFSLPRSATSGTARFYGKPLSLSPRLEDDERGRGRERDLAEDNSIHSRYESHSCSRSSSPGFFPFSPSSTKNSQWPTDDIHETEAPEPYIEPDSAPWFQAEFELQNPYINNNVNISTLSAPSTANGSRSGSGSGSGSQSASNSQGRFYSTHQVQSTILFGTRQWTSFNMCESRDSTSEENKSPDDLLQFWTRDSETANMNVHGEDDNKTTFYSVVYPTDAPQHQRRKGASRLLRKLASLGMRRKETVMVPNPRITGTVVDAIAA